MLLHALHIESIAFIEMAGVLKVGQPGMHGQVHKQLADAVPIHLLQHVWQPA